MQQYISVAWDAAAAKHPDNMTESRHGRASVYTGSAAAHPVNMAELGHNSVPV